MSTTNDGVDAAEIEKRVLELRLSDPSAGWKRIQAELKAAGMAVSENRLKKIMKSAGVSTSVAAAAAAGGVHGAEILGAERRKADVGKGHGLFATAAAKPKDVIFAVRPALAVVFEQTSSRVCAFCLCAAPSAAEAAKTTRVRKKLVPRSDGTFGIVFNDTSDGAVVVSCIDSDSPSRCIMSCGDIVAIAHTPNAAEAPKSATSLVEAMKASNGGLEVEVDRAPFSCCSNCLRAGVCERCAEMGAWGWHARECELFNKLPEQAKAGGDTSVIRFLLRWRVTLEVGPWFGSGGGETLEMVDRLQGNIVTVPQVRQLALVTGVPEDTVAKLMYQIRTNAIEIDVGGKAACALSAWVGYTNHSCDPSASVSVGKDGRVTMHAKKSIAPGDEISISYVDSESPVEDRQQVLKEHYGFTCKCTKCLKESGGVVKSRLQEKLSKKGKGGGGDVEVLSEEELTRRQKAADAAMAALMAEDEADKGKKKKKK